MRVGATAVFVVFELDVVLCVDGKGNLSAPFGGRLIDPFIDEQLIIYPEPHAIVRHSVDGVSFGELRLNFAGPTNREGIDPHGEIGRTASPTEIHCRVGARKFEGGEVAVVKVIAPEAAPSASRRIDSNRHAAGGGARAG